ncbi:MAG TPA: hypothetical protein VFR63_04610 [Gaiellaceae bacterium]|nr:hypothetical protein [Gaiellaceae bacterium]
MSRDSFTWSATKDGRVRVGWRGRVVTTLAGEAAARFLRQAEVADEETVQGLLARATGNFKRGNERRGV